MTERKISTTVLARILNKKNNDLFTLLARAGWIVFQESQWTLTEKGRFEGGAYINHPKFGPYIAWPESIQHHPLLALLPPAPLTATDLGLKWHIPARLINHVLAERGWLKKHIRGWMLSARGKALGGEQHFSEQSGIPYVTWPETLLDNSLFNESIAQITGSVFSSSTGQPIEALSGQLMSSAEALIVENWLYLAGVNHACNYRLTVGNESVSVDFFIPEFQVCVDLWGADDKAAALANKLAKQEFYQKHAYDFIEIRDENLNHLDELLAKQLLGFGLAIY